MKVLKDPCRKCGMKLVTEETDGAWTWFHCYGCGDVVHDRTGLPASASSTEQCGRRDGSMSIDEYDQRIRIGDLIHEARTARDMSQRELGEATGVKAATIGAIELGNGGDRPRRVLMAYLGISC